jgi:hypothetical protein
MIFRSHQAVYQVRSDDSEKDNKTSRRRESHPERSIQETRLEKMQKENLGHSAKSRLSLEV